MTPKERNRRHFKLASEITDLIEDTRSKASVGQLDLALDHARELVAKLEEKLSLND